MPGIPTPMDAQTREIVDELSKGATSTDEIVSLREMVVADHGVEGDKDNPATFEVKKADGTTETIDATLIRRDEYPKLAQNVGTTAVHSDGWRTEEK